MKMNLNTVAARAYVLAVEKGFWDDGVDLREAVIKAALIGCEVSEVIEELRRDGIDNPSAWTAKGGKPEGVGIELADVLIRTLDLMYALQIDPEEMVRLKHEYNQSRQHKHGKRL